jgi:hypothetical protein
MSEKTTMNTEELARFTHCSKHTIRRRCAESPPAIQFLKERGGNLFYKGAIEAYWQKHMLAPGRLSQAEAHEQFEREWANFWKTNAEPSSPDLREELEELRRRVSVLETKLQEVAA